MKFSNFLFPITFIFYLLFTLSVVAAPQGIPKNSVQNFLFIGGDSDNISQYNKQLANKNIKGVQIVYTWKQLEPKKDHYDFSSIRDNLNYLKAKHKKLFIQIQDRFFTKDAKYVPDYLLQEVEFDGGVIPQIDNGGGSKQATEGWVTLQWNDKVRERFQKLIKALAKEFDGEIYGINLPETAIDINLKSDNRGFTCDKYFQATLENIKVAKEAFKNSYVVQYVNFFPCEWDNSKKYMSRLFEFAAKNGVGLGGPDIVPYVYDTSKFNPNKLGDAPYNYQQGIANSEMHNAYPFFNKYKGKLSLIAMAVQSPDYVYINPKTKKHFTAQEFSDFATNYLGVNIIFWVVDKNIFMP
ncbi:hypothetical protein ACFX5K_02685 [Rickettsiales bacterium LUAb2]